MDLLDRLQHSLQAILPQLMAQADCLANPAASPTTTSSPHILLAFSGGLDSSVLLHLLSRLSQRIPMQLEAMHVHHGLSTNADAWSQFCQQTCQQYGITCQIQHVQLAPASDLGTEAEARLKRYQALMASSAQLIALAHHQDDQAETLLLQLMRGAAVKGLSGMPAHDPQRRLWRPLLGFSRTDLEDYAQQHNLQWIEDESNQSVQYERNFCRLQLIPLMRQRHPSIVHNLSRSAELMAQAQGLLDELAQLDAAQAVRPQGLDLAYCAALSPPRAANLLRYWLAQQGMMMPSQAQLQQVMQQLLHAKQGQQPALRLRHQHQRQLYWIRRYQGYASLQAHAAQRISHSDSQAASALLDGILTQQPTLIWQGEAELRLPDGSLLQFSQQMGQGISVKQLAQQPVSIQWRSGGERFKPFANRPSKTLKKWWQELQVPPWQRQRTPMLYAAERLLMVPGIGVQAEWQATAQEKGWLVTWLPAH